MASNGTLKLVKVWMLDEYTMSEQELEYCKDSGIHVEISKTDARELIYGSRVRILDWNYSPVRLYTFNDRGECMLKLRYSNRVTLMQQMHVDQSQPFFS